jgi:hypothetical protein
LDKQLVLLVCICVAVFTFQLILRIDCFYVELDSDGSCWTHPGCKCVSCSEA